MKTIVYILILNCIAICSYATGGDTTKVKYDINDPRNPDCPCHKYQKLADEEYQKIIANEQIQQASRYVGEKIVAVKTNKMDVGFMDVSEISPGSTVRSSSGEIKKVKVNKHAFSKRSSGQHKNHSPKKRRVRFGKKDNSRCSKW